MKTASKDLQGRNLFREEQESPSFPRKRWPKAKGGEDVNYRFHELISVYGTTLKALIHEEFGDGIMSAIDFHMDLRREPDAKGDRVQIAMSGKFLPYKTY